MAVHSMISNLCMFKLRIFFFWGGGALWLSGRASDSESRCPGFESHRRRHVVSLSKTH